MSDRSSSVNFTYESVAEYADIELVGQYLMAARIVAHRLNPLREKIAHLVDVGCGAGKSTRAAAPCVRSGGLITGLDISSEMVQQAKRVTTVLQANCDVRFNYRRIDRSGADEFRFPLDNEVADAVISVIVLQEIHTESQLRSMFLEITRILKTSGLFVAVCVSDTITCEDFTAFTYAPFPENANRSDDIRKCKSVVSSMVWENDRHWSREVLEQMLSRAGMINLAIDYPLADGTYAPFPCEPEVPWKDELRSPPFLVVCGQKAGVGPGRSALLPPSP